MFIYTDWLVRQEQYKDLLREAEQDRLAQLVVSAQPANKTEKKIMVHKKAQSKSVEVPCCNPTEITCCAA